MQWNRKLIQTHWSRMISLRARATLKHGTQDMEVARVTQRRSWDGCGGTIANPTKTKKRGTVQRKHVPSVVYARLLGQRQMQWNRKLIQTHWSRMISLRARATLKHGTQ